MVPSFVLRLVPWINFVWLVPALLVWSWEQYWHVTKGEVFSPLVFAKGVVLLAAAALLFHLGAQAFKGFSFLGLFPLLWLSASRFQWDICAPLGGHYWLWLLLFLGLEISIVTSRDGKAAISLWVPLWGLLSYLEPVSCGIPLSFLTVGPKRLKNPGGTRWFGLGAFVVFFVLFQEWKDFHFDWLYLFDLLITEKFLAFLLLGWLGWAAFPNKGTYRHVVFPLFWMVVGALFFNTGWEFYRTSLLQWVLVLFAGFGWESFRRDLMDSSWHGRLVWAALGGAFLGGVV